MDTKVISTGIHYSSLPESYIRSVLERPKLFEVEECEDVPMIDLVHQIGDACRLYGFFQVHKLSRFVLINHNVSTEAMEKMLEVASEFFRLLVEEKMKLYSDDPLKTMRVLFTSFNVKKETVHPQFGGSSIFLPPGQGHQLKSLFNAFNANNDGMISASEMSLFLIRK